MAETDLQRERILPLKEIMEKEIEFFKQFPEEDGKALKTSATSTKAPGPTQWP